MARLEEGGYSSIRLNWWRDHLDRRFWCIVALTTDANVVSGRDFVIRAVTDDFGNLVRVS